MNLIKESITLPAAYSVTGDAEEYRNALVLRAGQVTAVTSAAQNEQAGVVVREIRKHVKDVEAMRQTLTKPLLDAQRLLKSLADDHVTPLTVEISRIERLATDFQESERRRVAEEERKRQEEFTRLETQRLAAEAKATEAAQKMNTPKQLDAAVKAEEIAAQAEAKVQTLLAAPMPTLQRAKGQAMKQYLRWEVTDIKALYAARPELCNVEPKPAAIQSTCVPEIPVPGLKLWWENKATFSSR